MKPVKGGVCAAKGFQAAGVSANIKKVSDKKDCALIVSDTLASVAGVFTTNLVKAAPVPWCQHVCERGTARAIFANSGNANACTGDRGVADVNAITRQLADAAGLNREEVLVCSTGVIGVPLPMDRIAHGINGCLGALRREGHGDAAAAIMTTDTVPKEYAIEVELDRGQVRIGGMAKGAGMIAPNMATLLAFITTDALIAPHDLQRFLDHASSRSFNRICVDNDMSTNDTALLLANGAGGVEVTADSPDAGTFQTALDHVCTHLAKELVRDGEGATKLVEVHVTGAKNDEDAQLIANAIAVSQLCKTAFNGEDPNWGRIACAAGYAKADFDPNKLCVSIGDIEVMTNGGKADFAEAEAAAIMKREEFSITVSVGEGRGTATYWTSDLSKEYVSINADYRS